MNKRKLAVLVGAVAMLGLVIALEMSSKPLPSSLLLVSTAAGWLIGRVQKELFPSEEKPQG